VRKGETLWSIAAQRYGDGKRWREIADANGIDDPRKLAVGMELVIP
jgi:nucleoid-associated protein YgaU